LSQSIPSPYTTLFRSICFAQFKSKTLPTIFHSRRGRPVRAQRHPIAIIFAREIIFKRIPFLLRLIQPVHMPDPVQIVGAFRSDRSEEHTSELQSPDHL